MKYFFAIVFIFAFVPKSEAQYYFFNENYYSNNLLVEVGGSVGAMNALTDIGGRKGVGKRFVKDFNLKNTHLNGGLFVSFLYKDQIALRLQASFGTVSAYDSILKKVAASTNGRYERNLEFRSKIAEYAALIELHPFEMFGNYNEDRFPPLLSPYLLAGVGYFHFNPQATLIHQLVDLQPLSTEGQGFSEYPKRKPYKLNQINFPVGMGVRYDITALINMRLEFVYRILSTDYLDDVSTKYIDPTVFANHLQGNQLNQALILNDRHIPGAEYSTAHPDGVRGDPTHNDGYMTFDLKIGLTIGRQRTN